MNAITMTMAAALMSLAASAQDTAAPKTNTDAAAPKDAVCCPAEMAPHNGYCAWLNIETVTVAAENGDPIAQYTIAYLTDEGINTDKDQEKATAWYKKALPGLEKAAAKGHAGACRALAHMYAMGKGVEKDHAKAKQYMDACRKCSPAAKKDGMKCDAGKEMSKPAAAPAEEAK